MPNTHFRPFRRITKKLVWSLLSLSFLATTPAVAAPESAATSGGQDAQKTVQTPAATSHSVQDLMSAVAAAFGGMDKLKEARQRSYRAHGKVTVTSPISGGSNTFECDILGKGEKIRIETTVLGHPSVTAYDGKISWTQSGDWISAGTPTATRRIADEIDHGITSLADLASSSARAETIPPRTVGGKQCPGFKLTAGGRTTSYYFDPQTRLIVRTEFMGDDPEQGVRVVKAYEYADYKPVSGIPTPHKTVEYSGNNLISETVLQNIDADIIVDDKAFEMPPESHIAQLKRGPVIIPFEYAGNEIVVKVKVNGKDYPFIVDTGASQTVLDKAAAQSIGPHTVSTFTVTAGSKAVPLSYMTIPSFTIGDITLSNLPALVTDLSSLGQAMGSPPAGLIGANILRRFLVSIDYDDRKLVLSDPMKVSVPANAVVVPTIPVFGSTALVVRGEVDESRQLNFLVDTGAAFNNLPQSIAREFYPGPLMPVGHISGLDGDKIPVSSLMLKSLQIGPLKLRNPVFATTPEAEVPGLVSARSMGILGNPTWSRYKTTLDYRNERLILEQPAAKAKLDQFLTQIEQIDRDYLRNKDLEASLLSYEKVLVAAQTDKNKAAEALAVARIGSCYADKFAKDRSARWLDIAGREFEKAGKLAQEALNRSVEGKVLAQWALLYLNNPRDANDVTTARNLLTRALQKAPMEPSIYAAFGTTMATLGKHDVAEKLIDQAIMLAPDNWQALWTKLKLCQSMSKTQQIPQVVAQLQRYYPGFPEVVALSKKSHSGASNTGTASETTGTRISSTNSTGVPAAGSTQSDSATASKSSSVTLRTSGTAAPPSSGASASTAAGQRQAATTSKPARKQPAAKPSG